MRTKIYLSLLFLGLTSTVFAQRHATRIPHQNANRFENNRTSHSGEARRSVYYSPKPRVVFESPRPRIVIAPIAPTIVIERNHFRNQLHECENYLTNEDLCQINRCLNNIHNEFEKVEYVKDKLDFYYVTANQLSNIIFNFSFETNRLELAKYGFEKTIDPQNYDLVYNTLDFQSSKRDLDYYIDNQNICHR